MQAGGITGTDNFVMQDATQLIKNSGLRRVAGVITDAAALGERAVKGHGRNKCTCKPRRKKINYFFSVSIIICPVKLNQI